ncbi:putative acetyl-CoA transporter [Cyclospora cayetanensis]|uniref:Acetyl-CoA transporter n=1 Tax=Cyclospora cayetanensis TaxID=88456 RepID=A0A1D3D3M7_9EIME|nr:putative acetyl-CoA transporter [Cyclospora cayetanensis]
MAFFARVSDPRIGGSYMTFLNTMSNIGSQWPRAVSLWLMDSLSIKDCTGIDLSLAGATCPVVLDGYFVQVAACVILGLCWTAVFWPRVRRLQDIPLRCWRVTLSPPPTAESAVEMTTCEREGKAAAETKKEE